MVYLVFLFISTYRVLLVLVLLLLLRMQLLQNKLRLPLLKRRLKQTPVRLKKVQTVKQWLCLTSSSLTSKLIPLSRILTSSPVSVVNASLFWLLTKLSYPLACTLL